MIDLLKNDDPLVRQASAYKLGIIGDKSAVEPLIEAMSDDHEKDFLFYFLGKIDFAIHSGAH